VPARRSACLRRSGFAQAGVSARRRVRFATVRFIERRSRNDLDPEGVYITMDGKILPWDNVRNNKESGEFEG
jgi:hypothetical protein